MAVGAVAEVHGKSTYLPPLCTRSAFIDCADKTDTRKCGRPIPKF